MGGEHGGATALALRDELEQLAHDYQHLKSEHNLLGPESSARRHMEEKMKALQERFEHLIARWIDDEQLRHAWHRRFYHGDPTPDAPEPDYPLLFRGELQGGGRFEVRRSPRGGVDVYVDGKEVRHDNEVLRIEPIEGERFEILGYEVHERFDAPDEAIEALRAYVDNPQGSPPWEFARVLYDDGLIDRGFTLTPRGHRALGR
ncbi:MAG: hypothetical protein D6776_11205 [Planctomycetota bacterium]|nr:MAG: hypothetical protein D6776_11205 [Planctomycetota bacterium]